MKRLNAVKQLESEIALLEVHLLAKSAKRLESKELRRLYQDQFCDGWCINTIFGENTHIRIVVLIDKNYPYRAPRIAIPYDDAAGNWPHVENGGLMCILPPDANVTNDEPLSVADYLICEACQLIQSSLEGANVMDFEDEWLSYWQLGVSSKRKTVVSLLETAGPSRKINVLSSGRFDLLADDAQQGRRWLERQASGEKRTSNLSVKSGVLLWCDTPLQPSEFPESAAAVLVLAKKIGNQAASLLEEHAQTEQGTILVIIGAMSSVGAGFVGVRIKRPAKQSEGPRIKVDTLDKGFRPGRTADAVFSSRFFSYGNKVERYTVDRADHNWVHGRGHDPQQAILSKSRVAIIGCGSYGSHIACALAQSGVGNLILVDPEKLDWSNISRHVLGAADINENKALGTANLIETRFPHTGDITSIKSRFGSGSHDLIREMKSCDLIICAAAEWSAESFLSDLQVDDESFPQTIYCWLEAHAVAAHAVLLSGTQGCFRCQLDDNGRPLLSVACWPDGQETLPIPACGGSFTPYGAIEIAHATAMAAELAIKALTSSDIADEHSVWASSPSKIRAAGGQVSLAWLEASKTQPQGDYQTDLAWSKSKGCKSCHSKSETT